MVEGASQKPLMQVSEAVRQSQPKQENQPGRHEAHEEKHEAGKRGCARFVKSFVCFVPSWLIFYAANGELFAKGPYEGAQPPATHGLGSYEQRTLPTLLLSQKPHQPAPRQNPAAAAPAAPASDAN